MNTALADRVGQHQVAHGAVGVARIPLVLHVGESACQCFVAACDLPERELDVFAARSLAESESARLDRAAHPRRRISFLRGRVAAKEALAGLCGDEVSRRALEIIPGVFEQPVVTGPTQNLGVSLSHSDTLAVAAAFPESHPLGVDLERIPDAHLSALREQLAADDMQQLAVLGLSEAERLTLLWSAREALSKVLRGGLAVDFRALAVSGVRRRGELIDLDFVTFAHLRAELLVAAGQVFALIVPARCRAEWDVDAVIAWLRAGDTRQAQR